MGHALPAFDLTYDVRGRRCALPGAPSIGFYFLPGAGGLSRAALSPFVCKGSISSQRFTGKFPSVHCGHFSLCLRENFYAPTTSAATRRGRDHSAYKRIIQKRETNRALRV
jgi:hypothetical protein